MTSREAHSIAWPPVAAIGFAGGAASGLLGIGGGLVMVPALSLFLGVPIKRAVGTSLAAVIGIALVGIAAECLVAPSNVRWPSVAILAVAAVAGTFAGAAVVRRISAEWLARLFALVMVVAAARLARLPEALGFGAPDSADVPVATGGLALVALAATGLTAGVVAALFGIGGGIVMVPALALLHPEWGFHACRATSLATILPTSCAGALLHRRLDLVDVGLARVLLPGGAAGAVAGVLSANRIAARPLEILFAAVMVVAALRLLRGGSKPPGA